MSFSKVAIANLALSRIGQKLITDLGENSPAAILANANYDSARQAALQAYPWTFAKKRASLPALASGPLWGFTYAVQLPSDSLWIIETDIDERVNKWQIEGLTLVTDATPPIKILYIRDEADTTLFHPTFVEALAERLAAEIVFGITKRVDLRREFIGYFDLKIDQARTTDAQQGSPQFAEDTSLIDIR